MDPGIISPRHPETPTSFDGDYDEELNMQLHANVTPPPPPPPPPPRRNNKGESSRHERRTMVQAEQQEAIAEPPTVHREPLNAVEPDQQLEEENLPQNYHEQKEESGCEDDLVKSATKPPRPLLSKARPPRQSGSKSAEYASNLESFHLVMLENIEKETNLIRRQGSFQVHHDHLNNQKNTRKQLDGTENYEQHGTPKRKGRDNKGSHTQLVLDNNNANVGSLLKETMNDISVATATAMQSINHLIQQHTQQDHDTGKSHVMVGGTKVQLPVNLAACGKIEDSATAFMEEDDDSAIVDSSVPRKSTTSEFLQQNKVNGNDIMKKMHDGLKKLVVDATNATKDRDDESRNDQQQRSDNENSADAWGVGNLLANGFGWEGQEDEDDIQSKATYDTWDEENSVLRRLGSWGTVNSQYTAGTTGTFGTMATYETEGPSVIGPVSASLAKAKQQQDSEEIAPPGSHHLRKEGSAIHDDDGSLINPALVEAAQRKKKKRKGRRKKVVKFDYPPIKSLRQYTRPDPEDLPNLFFTEQELDQIEDDRYSTMSTDDIEIVAVASKESSPHGDEDDSLDARAAASKSPKAAKQQQVEEEPDYEPGFKPVKGRSGTPNRRRPAESPKKSPGRDDAAAAEGEEASSPRRLVKGVQIYLRERSTGA